MYHLGVSVVRMAPWHISINICIDVSVGVVTAVDTTNHLMYFPSDLFYVLDGDPLFS